MRIKTHWRNYLHDFRKRERDFLFQNCPEKLFANSLEIGAGDGWQSLILAKYSKKLISTDINPQRLQRENVEDIQYMICDAEKIDSYFPPKIFDFIFSSNLFEHLPNPGKALQGCSKILKDDGLIILIMPNVFWKFSNFFLWIPFRLVNLLEKITNKEGIKDLSERLVVSKPAEPIASKFENNQKIVRTKRTFLRTLFTPDIHGIAGSHWQEFKNFTKRHWLAEITANNLEVVAVKKGPFSSGYGFGFRFLTIFLEKIGIASEYIYIINKKGFVSPDNNYFK